MSEKKTYHIEILGQAIGHAEVIGMPYARILEANCTRGNIFRIVLQGDLELQLNRILGGRFTFIFSQDTIGGHNLIFGPEFLFSENQEFLIDHSPGSVTMLDCIIEPGSGKIYTLMTTNFS